MSTDSITPGEAPERSLHDSWQLAGITVPNRVLLAPLAGIGNWFVRFQAQRHGAGMTVSEMVSSFAIHYRNEKTCQELLKVDERERRGGPLAIQLFGQDVDVMRSAAAYVAEHARPDVIDLNMGCPVPKVMGSGAGAAMLKDPDTAVAVAKAAREGSGLPVTVKLRSGIKKGEHDGYAVAQRLVEEAGVSAITFHPRSAQVQHKGAPDLELAAKLVAELPVPVILSGGMNEPEWITDAWRDTGAEAIMLARGALGDPWLFARVLGLREGNPTREEIVGELLWVMDQATGHLGEKRATGYLRKFYPWYVETLGDGHVLQNDLQRAESLDDVRTIVRGLVDEPAPVDETGVAGSILRSGVAA
ncbi:MAG: tRNA-dihydrouridine synthase family protein [Solirubrobacteraceae bacterium]|nr:tRNA-dihydrouridine synthase family protein [Solirubrobacteraceae bacterium]